MKNAHVESIRIRYGETDQMGHAYYGSYTYWFEQARNELCRRLGASYVQVEERGVFLPVVELHAQYKRELLFDDIIEVTVAITEIRRATVRFDYEIRRRGDETVRTTGYTIHVTMGRERRAITIPDDLREILGRDPALMPDPSAGHGPSS